MQVSKRRKRVKVSIEVMLMALCCLVLIDLVFLIAWTVVSPLKATEALVFSNDGESDIGSATTSTIVESSTICRSNQSAWQYASDGWHGLLLLVAAVLAFVSRSIVFEHFNESRIIGMMVYSQFVFMIVRWIVLSLGRRMLIAPNVFGASMGLLYAMDTMLSTTIYVIPKCLQAKKDPGVYNPDISSESIYTGSSLISSRRSSSNPFFAKNANDGQVDGSVPSGKLRMSAVGMSFDCDFSGVSNLRGRQQRRKPRAVFSTHSVDSDGYSGLDSSTSFNEAEQRSASNKGYSQKSISNNGTRSIMKSDVEFYGD